ncbi:pimeloyl-ACP methyl ester carboxylesterase [Kribbella antiqua]|uniref:Pimeloyl-ACP methyl ester carboxylesterase n=1 Tax=Kribbella antiqua TaxID=2512217 RepID=A0A4R2IK76_9ACTN|nr:alpha/beta hydrolase [Kribbella antiqua]TCO45491.1 pimeloyl-ACP methyl ester carboxylesterase [Kribbella antiqua]
MELVDVGGRRIAYHRAGAGEPAVLLHGGWSDGRAWQRQLAGLAGFDLIAWDAPGCGGSADPAARMTLSDYADVLAEVVTALGVERAHLCGLSWGGGLAIAVWQRHPELVRSLVLAGAYAGWKGSLPPDEVEARVRRIRAEAERPPAEWMDGYLPSFFAGPVPAEATQLIRTMMAESRPAGSLMMLTAFAEADLSAVLPTIDVPTLLLWGECDQRAPVGTVAATLWARIPGAELVVLPGVGHYNNLEAPEEFNAEVRRFLGDSRR